VHGSRAPVSGGKGCGHCQTSLIPADRSGPVAGRMMKVAGRTKWSVRR
jgi:hypothetical protein